jgi:hypothetical protein
VGAVRVTFALLKLMLATPPRKPSISRELLFTGTSQVPGSFPRSGTAKRTLEVVGSLNYFLSGSASLGFALSSSSLTLASSSFTLA